MNVTRAGVVVLGVSMVLALVTTALAGASLTFISTQFSPIQEQEFFRNEVLSGFTRETGVQLRFVTEDYGPFMDRILAEGRAGRFTVSLVGTLHGDFPVFTAAGIPSDLRAIETLGGRTFIEEFKKLGQMDGKQVYVPWVQATYLMVANKKALAYLPPWADPYALTYDQLLLWARNLQEATGGPKLGFPAGPRGLFGRMLHGYLYPAFTGSQVRNFNSPEAVAMWSYLKELFRYAHPSSLIWEAMADPLLLEEVWVAWDHTARLGPAVRERPDAFVVLPSPAGPKGRAFIAVLAGLMIPRGAPEAEAAWKLIEYLTRPQVQVKVLQGTGFFPTVMEASGHLPEGPLRVLAEGVTRQAGSPDAMVSLLPVGLGGRTGEYVPIFTDAFHAIVVQNRPIGDVLGAQERKLRALFQETGAPLPQP